MPQASKLATRVELLNLGHLDSVVKLEEASFPPNEAATREKFIYRLTRCGELSLGLMTSATPNSTIYNAPTAATGPPADSINPERKEVLLGHIFATKTRNQTVKDADMALPADWEKSTPQPGIGHDEAGRTLAIHSVAILPQLQRQGLGRMLMRAYIQRVESSGIADRIALLSHEEMIPFYEKVGFKSLGKSSVEHGGGGWFDMVLELKTPKEAEEAEAGVLAR
jgi:ribosomal protein S18 acetylase RimI-like enzyme